MSEPLNFQSIVMTLQHFWADRGCLIWQPYYAQIGAGTMNPATFLRVLGPEPWNIAYVEPSIRPDDARYGENPNRMQQHYQFQVILKPDPGNPQEIYLRSLEALGIDPKLHDIRFVEDNWEQPALGAWGLGWEVWLDGQEITQFTYFQQAGGITLDPVSVEITYGLDRIAIALQRVHGFQEIQWNDLITMGEVNLQAEREHSTYYFEVADVERLRQMYDLFEAESRAALERGLILPAYDYLLKCSHTFNVLDTRGAIGVTERQAFFGRMRDVARKVAEAYLEERQRLEYPWLEETEGWSRKVVLGGGGKESGRAARQAGEREGGAGSGATGEFLLEVGTEELPAGDLAGALEQLSDRVPNLLEELRLEHGEIHVMGTPRRLVVSVAGLADRQADLEELVKGPPASRAFDSLGQPTRAAEGFARSKGVAVSDLKIQELDGGRYTTTVIHHKGSPVTDVLSEAIPKLIASLRFDKSMRWNSTNISFSRPIRWLLALYGGQVVPIEYAGLRSGDATRGLRFSEPEEIPIDCLETYFAELEKQGIVLEVAERRDDIKSTVLRLASEVKGRSGEDPALLAEVTNLVEAPAGIRGGFDPSHLDLPGEVLVSVMKKHQRYFPVEGEAGLLPYFIAITNHGSSSGDNLELVVEGNEHVIRARFADAAFFIRDDLKKPLEAYLSDLKTLTFQVDLGSMLEKTHRIHGLVGALDSQVGLGEAERTTALRTAQLCKADLATKMVVEMTSLQGIMGRYYAVHSGEPDAVGTAIYEHYLPRYAGDQTPQTRPGLAVGLADRLDSLAGLFAAGLAPTGTRDPFAQRRAALGVVVNLIAWNLRMDLRHALAVAAKQLPIPASQESQSAAMSFIVERLRNLLLEQGYRYDVVDSVLVEQGQDPAGAAQAVPALIVWVERSDWNEILPAYARCVRITRDQALQYDVKATIFAEPAERKLYEALLAAESTARAPGSVDDFLNAFLPLIPSINRFFDEVLVMTEDREQRENRLGLLQRIARLAAGVADMSRLEGF